MEDPFEWKTGLDASPDFIPSEEYTNLLERCDSASKDILTGDVLNYRKDELKLVLEKYDDLFNEVDKYLTQYERFEEFVFLFDALISAYLFLDKYYRDAYFAIDDYGKFDMWIERNLINWLFSYEYLNDTIAQYFFYNTDYNCEDKTSIRISCVGINLQREDLSNILEFSILYCEHYAHLLKKYMYISEEEFQSFKVDKPIFFMRDHLFHNILKSKK
ncbi:hypothetical protein PPZ62_05340 [Aquirufa nivalisilvae]